METGGISCLSGRRHYICCSRGECGASDGVLPRLLPGGFCGYYSEEQDGKLYVGFRFSAVFGLFETGDFAITIPVQGDINEVIVKSRMNETPVWDAENGFICQSERYGVFVKLERNDVYYVSMSYDGSGGGMSNADGTALESGEYFYMDNDIMMASKDADAPYPLPLPQKAQREPSWQKESFLLVPMHKQCI